MGGLKPPPPPAPPSARSLFYLFLLLTSFLFLFSRSLRNINAMREFENVTEYQAFENYDISGGAIQHSLSNKAENIHRPHQQLYDLLSKKNGALSVWTCTIRKFIITSLRRSIARLQSFHSSRAIFRNVTL